jgi:Dolichyl-phosphate-mannose-protein mannosyltransferase
MHVKLGRHTGIGEPARVGEVLVAEDVEITDIDVGVGQAAEVGGACGRGVWRDLLGTCTAAEQCAPAGDVVVIGPGEERHQLGIGRGRAVVEHRIDQQLLGHGRPAAVASQQANARRKAATCAVPHHRDPGRVHSERRRMLGKPLQRRVTVLHRGGVRMLGRDPVVDDENRHSRVRDVIADNQVDQVPELLEAEDHPATVQVQNGAAGLLGGGLAIPAEREGRAVPGEEFVPFDLDAARRSPVGKDLIEGQVDGGPPTVDVSDGDWSGFAPGLEYRGELREHLGVGREGHCATVTWRCVTTPETEISVTLANSFAAKRVLAIAGLVAVLHCAAIAFSTGYWFDEVYMLAIGRYHLDWGSADQPPLAPALAALADQIAPGSRLILGLPAVLATAGAVVVAGLIARELGCDRRAQGLVAGAQATVAWSSFAGHWLTPYTLEPVQWLLVIWLLVRWARLRDDHLLVALGGVVGLAAMTKFQVLLLCGALLLAVAAVGPRELLRRPLLWAGAAIAAVLVTPTLIWQHVHGWPQLRMASVVAGEADVLYGGRPGIAVQLVVFAGVVGVALAMYGLWRLFRDDALRYYRFLAVTFVAMYVAFLATAGRPYYLAGLYAPLAAAGALAMQRRRETGRARHGWLVWPAYLLSAALAAGALALSVSVVRSDVDEQIAARTADVYASLPAGLRDRTAVIGESYIVAAYLDGYSHRYDLPRAYSSNRSYGYFEAPPDDDNTALFIGRDPGALREHFALVRAVGEISEDMHAYLLTGQRQPWQRIWPRLRSLTVS